MKMLYQRAQQWDQVQAQEDLLKQFVCENEATPDPEACKDGVVLWWPLVNELLFDEAFAPLVCSTLSNNECQIDSIKAVKEGWNCEACTADIMAVAALYKSEDAATEVVNYLSGPALCEDESDAEFVELCKTIIAQFMPAALQALFSALEANAQGVCYDVFDGICDQPPQIWQ